MLVRELKRNLERARGIRITLDNGGGIILQVRNHESWIFAHYYAGKGGASQAALDILEYLTGSAPHTWDGNEVELHTFQATPEQLSNGGYRVCYDLDDLVDTGWNNGDELLAELVRQCKNYKNPLW